MANKPTNTIFGYEQSEMTSGQQKAIRLGDIWTAGNCTVEKDMSGNGKSAWNTLLTIVSEDIGIANPTACATTLMLFNRWNNLMRAIFNSNTGKSHTNSDARKLIVCALAFLTESRKSRLAFNASVVSVKNDLSYIKDLDIGDELKDLLELRNASSWVKKLGHATGTTGPKNTGIDIETVMDYFIFFLNKTVELWGDVAEEKNKPNSDSATVQKQSIGTDTQEEQPSKQEVALQLEVTLLGLAQMIYAVDSIEGRTLPYEKPAFVKNAVDMFPNTLKEDFSHIMGKSEKMFIRPIGWVYQILVAKAIKDKKKTLLFSILSLLEMSAKKLGNDRLNFINAILFVARHRNLQWEMKKNVEAILLDPKVKDILALYDEYPYDNPIDPESLAKRRHIHVPDTFIDKCTFRGKGKSTVELLQKYAKEKGFDLTAWSEEERAKSHGTARVFQYKNKRQGLPTPLSFFLDEGTKIEPKLSIGEDPYLSQARDLLLEEEDNFGIDKANIDTMARREYLNWVKIFPKTLPDIPEKEEEDDDDESSKPAKKSKGKTKSKKSVKEDEQSEEDSQEKPLKKTSKSKSIVKKTKKVESEQEEGGSEEENITKRKTLVITSADGKKIKLKDVEYQVLSDEEKIKKKKQSSLGSSKKKQSQINRLDGSEDDADGSSSEEDQKKINRLKKHLKKGNLNLPTPNTGKGKKKQSRRDSESEQEEERRLNKKQSRSKNKKSNKNKDRSSSSEDEEMKSQSEEDGKSEDDVRTRKSKKRSIDSGDDDDDEDDNKSNKKQKVEEKISSKKSKVSSKSSDSGKTKKTKSASLATFDLVEGLNPRKMTVEEKEARSSAPLAKKIGPAKKFIYMTENKVYKGPYSISLERDVTSIQRILFRSFVLILWKDPITPKYELVYDEKEKHLYLVYDRIGGKSSDEWEIEEQTLKTHDKQTVNIIKKGTDGVSQLSKIVQSKKFPDYISAAAVNLAGRYLLGSGDSHLGNIIVDEETGTLLGVDIEENRENVPLITDDPKPQLTDLLFVNTKKPGKKDYDRFFNLLFDALPSIRGLITSVRNQKEVEIDSYAKKIGYSSAPTGQILQKRLDTLEQCVIGMEKEREYMSKYPFDNNTGIAPLPVFTDEKMEEISSVMDA